MTTLNNWYHSRQALRLVQSGSPARAYSEHLVHLTDQDLAEAARDVAVLAALIRQEQNRREDAR